MKKIYFLHDDQEDATNKIKFLEIAGFDVTVMQSAPECLAKLENETPDIIIADALIHGMTGFDFCLAVRQRFSPARVAFILCSGIYKGSTFEQEALRIGAQHYLIAPVQLDELIRVVHSVAAREPDTDAA